MKQHLYSFDLDHNLSQGVIIHLLIELDARKRPYSISVDSHGPGGGNPHVRIVTRAPFHVMVSLLERYVGRLLDDAWAYEPTDVPRLVLTPEDDLDWHEELRDIIAKALKARRNQPGNREYHDGEPDCVWVRGRGEDDWDLYGQWGLVDRPEPVYICSIDRQDISGDLAQCLDEDDGNEIEGITTT